MYNRIIELNQQFEDAAPEEVISWFAKEYKNKVTFSTSLGIEDQMITHIIATLHLPVNIFTLDTGRLFQETYDTLSITEKKYGIPIKLFFPDANHVEEMVKNKGINLFYESVEARKLCCYIRKIEPLKRALSGMTIWITGLRREQSPTRQDVQLVEWDTTHQMIKVNPLIQWTLKDVSEFVRKNYIPVNELHQKNFPSIGCMPCTRAVQPGEDLRAGRWWWEISQNKECGLHK
ncbi:MAG: phosphoadenylyl-sulfate reductase [Bacteroidales bacterium]|nr:phosphoadenylyl-sulfate reductase [Bacteroidales bacterium]MDD4604337.1 phosphoadenylyl-sulfate reductase [Bacteroidales bacterium]